MELANVIPAGRALGSNVPDHVSGNSVLLGQFIKEPSPSGSGSNSEDISFGKLRVEVFRTLRSDQRSMSNSIRHVFRACRPAQILRGSIFPVTVRMSRISAARRRWAVKRLTDQPVNLEGFRPAFNLKAYQPVSMSMVEIERPQSSRNRASSKGAAPDAAKVGHLIVRGDSAPPPFFFSHNQRLAKSRSHGKRNALSFQKALQAGNWA